MTSLSTSTSLIRLAAAQDEEAWVRLSRLYVPLVYDWCRKAKLQEADIADVVQNVFTSVYKNLSNFRRVSSGAFRSWLWTITRNEIHAHYRRLAQHPEAEGGTDAQWRIEQLPEILQSEIVPVDPTAVQQLVHRALGILQEDFSPTTWQAFWRTAVDGQSAPDVAEELGISPGAVRQAKLRILRRLQELLADD